MPPGRTRLLPPCSTPPSPQASRSDSHAGHAFLHDFCMTIPFGAIAAAVGGVSLFLGMAAFGAKVASAGAAVLLASVLSLKTWKAGAGTTPYTLASAGVCGTSLQRGAPPAALRGQLLATAGDGSQPAASGAHVARPRLVLVACHSLSPVSLSFTV